MLVAGTRGLAARTRVEQLYAPSTHLKFWQDPRPAKPTTPSAPF